MVRPRTTIPEPEEMIKLGEEMIEWIQINNPIHLSQWWSIEKFFTEKVWECMHRASEFLPYYTKALRMIGMNYLDKDSKVDVRLKDRWQRVYFKDLRQEEDETARFMHSLKVEELEKLSPEIISKYKDLMDLMRKNQERKIDETNKSAESKS